MVLFTLVAAASYALGVIGAGAPEPPGSETIAAGSEIELEMGPNVGAQPKPREAPKPPEGEGEKPESRWHVSLGADYTNRYMWRGLLSEDAGLIVQPYADVCLDVLRTEAITLSLKGSTWSSFHGVASGPDTRDSAARHWYECDLGAGVGLEAGHWSLSAMYYWETSPADAFDTIEEVILECAYDDSGALGAWSLKPTARVAVEAHNGADGGRRGTYLQLGVTPGFDVKLSESRTLRVDLPASVGLSVSNYYEGPSGQNDAFGYASVGVDASLPLALGDGWGEWTIHAGVQGVILGDAATEINNGRDFEVIATVGAGVEF